MNARTRFLALVAAATAIPAVLLPTAAHAGGGGHNSTSDLAVSVAPPASTLANTVSHYQVNVTNVGNKASGNVTVTIQLPKTNTSPQVLVLGELTNLQGCTRTGTTLSCALAPIARNGSASVSYDLKHPASTAPIATRVDVTTTNDANTANNGTTFTLGQTYWTVPSTSPAPVTVRLCTGSNLISFFECEAFPSSIITHPVTLAPGGVLDFSAIGGGHTGTWSVNGTTLTMTYDGVGTFVGNGAKANCWEGRMSFLSGAMSIYQVCR